MTEDVKERIVDVAARLFMEQGFAATSVRMIGEAAGVGQSSLYHHVQSKTHLLVEIHRSFIEELLEELGAVEGQAQLTAAEQVREIIRVVLSTVEMHKARVTVFLREWHSLPDGAYREIQAVRDEVDGVLDRILQRGVERGEFRADIDVHLTRLGIYGMCNWSYQWFRPGGSYTSQEIADRFASLVIDGLATTGRASS